MEKKVRAKPELGERLRLRGKLLRERQKLLADMDEHARAYGLTGGGHVVDAGDLAGNESEFDLLAMTTGAETERLFDIDEALARLDGDRYGTCQECGRRIAKARLAALPHANRCVRCERQHEASVWTRRGRRDLPPYLALGDFSPDEESEERVFVGCGLRLGDVIAMDDDET